MDNFEEELKNIDEEMENIEEYEDHDVLPIWLIMDNTLSLNR